MICRVMVVLPEDSGPKISDDPAARNAADTQRRVKADGPGGDHGNRQQRLAGAEPHNRPLPELFFNLCKGKFYGFGAVVDDGHWEGSSKGARPAHLVLFRQETARGLNWISMGL